MANFELYGKFEVKKEGVTVESVAQLLKISLSKYYDQGKVTVTPTAVMVKGNLKSFWERAITKSDAQLTIENNQLSYRVDGTSSLGGWPWVWGYPRFFYLRIIFYLVLV